MTLYLQALLGIAVFIALVLPMSRNRRRINWKLVGIAVVLQFVICLLLLKAPVVKEGLLYMNQAVGALGAATLKGT
ncbi:MAG: Na+ dependent nucleoside transporter N-terminal domain-containing protein [Gammaproteobacteria bacterium]